MIEWKFKEDAEPQGGSDGFWYDIHNGYISPEKVLANPEQLEVLKQALDTISSFERALEEAELVIEF